MSGTLRQYDTDRGSRRVAKAAVLAVALAALTGAGLSGALAKHGADDWGDWDIASGGSGGGLGVIASGGGEDDWVFGSGGSGDGVWDDDWTVASGGSGGWDDD